MAVDGSGNAFVTGMFWVTVDFDPGAGVDERTSNGYTDSYVSSFTSSGDHRWVDSWGGKDNDSSNSVAADSDSFSYATGFYRYDVDFNPGDDVEMHTSNGVYDAFIVKYTPDGGW